MKTVDTSEETLNNGIIEILFTVIGVVMKKILILTLILAIFILGCSTNSEDGDSVNEVSETIDEVAENTVETPAVAEEHVLFEKYEIIAANENYITIKGAGFYTNNENIIPVADASWREHLKYFLASNYPSLFSEAAIKKNDELYRIIGPLDGLGKLVEIAPEDIPRDVMLSIPIKMLEGAENRYSIQYWKPIDCGFFDLDGDDIPEIFIYYALMESGAGVKYIYQFIENSYEVIGVLGGGEHSEDLYFDRQNRIVCIGPNSIELFELRDRAIVFNDYTDMNGSETYNGAPYSKIGTYTFGDFDINGEELYEYLGIKPLIKIDFSDIINSIKDPALAKEYGEFF